LPIHKPWPSPEVEFGLREGYRSRTGLGIALKQTPLMAMALFILRQGLCYGSRYFG